MVLYHGCPKSSNLTVCDMFTCDNFNAQIYSNSLVVAVQGTFAIIFVAIFCFCSCLIYQELARSGSKNVADLNIFVHRTPIIILFLVGTGALSRSAYFAQKIRDHYVERVWDEDVGCCVESGIRHTSLVATEVFKTIRDICFSWSFILLVQSWIEMQYTMIIHNREARNRYSKHRFFLMILSYGSFRVLECIFNILNDFKDDTDATYTALSLCCRIGTLLLYLAIFVYALPYGFGMLKRLNLALREVSTNSKRVKSNSKTNPIRRSFLILRRFIMLMTTVCVIFWLTHLVVFYFRQVHSDMEYCSPESYVYVKLPEKILECVMVACLIATLSNRNKAKKAASKYSVKKRRNHKGRKTASRSSATSSSALSKPVRTSFSGISLGFVSSYASEDDEILVESDDEKTGVECISAEQSPMSIVKEHVDATKECVAVKV